MNPALQISPELISCIVCCIQIPLKRVVEIIFGMFSWFEQHCWHCCHAAPVALTKPEIRIPNSPRTHRARQFPINVTTIPDWIPDRGLSESPFVGKFCGKICPAKFPKLRSCFDRIRFRGELAGFWKSPWTFPFVSSAPGVICGRLRPLRRHVPGQRRYRPRFFTFLTRLVRPPFGPSLRAAAAIR